MRGDNVRWAVGGGLLACLMVILATHGPTTAVLLVGCLMLAVIATRFPHRLSVLLLVLAVPMMRPLLMGERLSPVSIALSGAAALTAAASDSGQRMSRSTVSLLFWVSAAWLWEAVLIARPGSALGNFVRGVADVPVVLFFAAVVLRDAKRRDAVVRTLTAVVLISCASFVVTVMLWQWRGVGSFPLGNIPAGYKAGANGVPQTVPTYFPFTTTAGFVRFGSTAVPRFLGLGREPGVMAALIAACYFLLARLGWTRRIFKMLLLIGLLGTQSTAGFGVFVVLWTVRQLVPRPNDGHDISLNAVVRQWTGAALLVAAIYLALFAPVYGLEAKSTINAVSVSDRSTASKRGIESIASHPFGRQLQPDEAQNASINIIGGLAEIGVPGTLFLFAGLVRPLMVSGVRRRAFASVLVIVGTVLTAQPLLNSTALFLVVLLSCDPIRAESTDDVLAPVLATESLVA